MPLFNGQLALGSTLTRKQQTGIAPLAMPNFTTHITTSRQEEGRQSPQTKVMVTDPSPSSTEKVTSPLLPKTTKPPVSKLKRGLPAPKRSIRFSPIPNSIIDLSKNDLMNGTFVVSSINKRRLNEGSQLEQAPDGFKVSPALPPAVRRSGALVRNSPISGLINK